MFGEIGRASVQGNARAHPVGDHVGVRAMAQESRAVAEAALAGQVARGFGKESTLVGDAAGVVRVGDSVVA